MIDYMKALLLRILLCLLFLPLMAWGQKPDRKTPPQPEAPRNLVLPKLQTLVLKNGMKVFFIQKTGVPVISLDLYVHGGSAADPADKAGLAAFTTQLMKDGAGVRNALELADEIDYLGINLSTGTRPEYMTVGLYAPIARLDAALDLVRDVTLKPRFAEEEWQRRQREALVGLAQAHDEARVIAQTALNQAVYGKNHPYSRRASEASIKNIQATDLQSFHKQYFTPNNGFWVAVGDISAAALKQKLEARFGAWTGGKLMMPAVAAAPKTQGRTILLVDKPGAAQTELRFGNASISRNTPDFFPIIVMNTILGGSFTSRLNQNLRETHGYAYGASSNFAMERSSGNFIAASAVQTDVTDKAIQEFLNEFAKIKTVTADELTRARNYTALGYPENFSSVGSIGNELFEQQFYKLPADHFSTYIAKVLAVQQSDVARVAHSLVDANNMVMVFVGDLSKIKTGIEALNLGTLKVITKEEILGEVPKL